MRCMMCENFSFSHICKTCQQNFLQPSLYKRKLSEDITVISFYKYDEIKELLHTKHTDLGYHIYNILAKLSFAHFAENFHTKERYHAVAIDDVVQSGYSHTAILAKHLQSYNITPHYNLLRAHNKVSYSGKSKSFREQNPRGFTCNAMKLENIILVDDIITTGTTMKEAVKIVGKERATLCLCLADVRR